MRIHIEEDAGKDIHDIAPDKSYIDYNRSGVPLIEIVTYPDISSPEEASQYLKELRNILVYLDVCDGNMEEGSLRCDANVSVRPIDEKGFGVKTEIKNLNSFKFVEKALAYEIDRHIKKLQNGEKIEQETMLFDSREEVTRPIRSKEESHDYRYFEEPDLLPLILKDSEISDYAQDICELPKQKKKRYIEEMGLSDYDANILIQDKEIAYFFEDCVKLLNEPSRIASFIINEYLKEINSRKIEISHSPVNPHRLVALLKQLNSRKITLNMAKEIFGLMFEDNRDVNEIIKEKGYEIINDTDEIKSKIRDIIATYPQELKRYKSGNQNLLGFFMGEIMKAMKGKIDPRSAKDIVKAELDKFDN